MNARLSRNKDTHTHTHTCRHVYAHAHTHNDIACKLSLHGSICYMECERGYVTVCVYTHIRMNLFSRSTTILNPEAS